MFIVSSDFGEATTIWCHIENNDKDSLMRAFKKLTEDNVDEVDLSKITKTKNFHLDNVDHYELGYQNFYVEKVECI